MEQLKIDELEKKLEYIRGTMKSYQDVTDTSIQLLAKRKGGSGGDTTEILSKIEEVRTLTVEETRKLQEGKQDKLVSGTNIKTINNITVLGSGNIDTSPTSLTDDDIVSIFNT